MGTVASPVLIVWTESGAVRSRGSAGPQCSKYYQTLSWKRMCSAASFCVWGIFSRSLDQSSLTTKARVSFFHFLFLRKDNSFLLTFFFLHLFFWSSGSLMWAQHWKQELGIAHCSLLSTVLPWPVQGVQGILAGNGLSWGVPAAPYCQQYKSHKEGL